MIAFVFETLGWYILIPIAGFVGMVFIPDWANQLLDKHSETLLQHWRLFQASFTNFREQIRSLLRIIFFIVKLNIFAYDQQR